jgi:hypothetical protein
VVAEVETVAKKAKKRVRQVKAGLAEKLAEMVAVAVAVDCSRVLPWPIL